MNPPFTTEQFLGLFREYNEAVWPLQAVWLLLALTAAAAAFRPGPGSRHFTPLVLGALWAWMALVYHLTFFRRINPLAVWFGLGFLLQAGLFVALGLKPGSLRFRAPRSVRGLVGGVLQVFAIVGYPTVAGILGHSFPVVPTFGLPCPTTIFTLGLLLWLEPVLPLRLLAIPLLWSVIGTLAALSLGTLEDLALGLAGLVTVLVVSAGRRSMNGTLLHPGRSA